MDHISGNKSIMGSIEVLIDRECPDKEPVKVLQITFYLYGHG
jgi:hypothetical protein